MLLNSAVITEPRSDVFAVLDVGSSKVVCLCVRVDDYGIPEVIGVGHRVSQGIDGGAINNKDDASCSILSSIDLAEQISGQKICQVYISVAGCGIQSHNISNELLSCARDISERDVNRIMLQSHEKFPGNDVVIHNVPVSYHLDSLNNVAEVRGLYGGNLRADMHIVTASRFALINIENCLKNNNIRISGCVAESYASGIACLTHDEKELGTMIVDMGGSYTSVGVFYKGKFVYAGCVPFGGMHITKDLAYGLCISLRDAEKIQELHGGSDLFKRDADCNPIEVAGISSDSRYILESDIVAIIRPRVEEIFEFVKHKMDEQESVVSKVVITGGCSKLFNIEEISSHVLSKQVRCALPSQIKGMWTRYDRDPRFSSALGTALLIVQTFFQKRSGTASSNSRLDKLLRWIMPKTEA